MTILDSQPLLQGKKQNNGMRFSLVSELLGAVLGNQDKEIMVGAKSQNFSYDQGQCLETG